MTDENFTSYEMMLIVDPTLGEDRTHEVIEGLKKNIKDLEGTVTFEDLWGTRYISYKIKRHDKGYYVVLNFNLAPTKLLELTNELRLDQNILRFITLKTPKNYEVLTLEALEKEAEKYKKAKKEEAPKEEAEAPRRASRPAPRAKVEEKEEVKVEEKPVKKEEPKVVEVKEGPVEEKVEEKVEEVKEEPVETPAEEEKEEPKKKESKITDLDDVDAKLKSIIDDPDISL